MDIFSFSSSQSFEKTCKNHIIIYLHPKFLSIQSRKKRWASLIICSVNLFRKCKQRLGLLVPYYIRVRNKHPILYGLNVSNNSVLSLEKKKFFFHLLTLHSHSLTLILTHTHTHILINY